MESWDNPGFLRWRDTKGGGERLQYITSESLKPVQCADTKIHEIDHLLMYPLILLVQVIFQLYRTHSRSNRINICIKTFGF